MEPSSWPSSPLSLCCETTRGTRSANPTLFQASQGLHCHPDNLAKATLDAISKTYSCLTPDLWKETVFIKSPHQGFTDHLIKTHTRLLLWPPHRRCSFCPWPAQTTEKTCPECHKHNSGHHLTPSRGRETDFSFRNAFKRAFLGKCLHSSGEAVKSHDETHNYNLDSAFYLEDSQDR
ncbi:hypothetical protein GH733_010856 [Mirounga leonina]|nr:hypothetical protein GH733_010856 [Mirounga leonina]